MADRGSDRWQQFRNIISYPCNWQHPAITEQHAYTQACARLPQAPSVTYVGFPWATLIDLLHARQHDKAEGYLSLLRQFPHDAAPRRVTVAQHIYLERFAELFTLAGITDIFWSHAVRGKDRIGPIRIHPFPLFPVRCLDDPDQADGLGKPFADRKYLYSFLGAYHPRRYLTKTREWIARLPQTGDSVIRKRDEWFFEQAVYDRQIFHRPVDEHKRVQLERDAETYLQVLRNSVFSLCPSGTGPNNIRLWESLGLGCIPVILSDRLRLPGSVDEWQEAAVFIPEEKKAIQNLPHHLRELAEQPDLLRQRQEKLRGLWERYGHNCFIYDLLAFCTNST